MQQPFELVVAAHGAVVLRVCRAILGPVEADDAWSETFLAALRAWPALPEDANVRAWLVTIAHRKAVDERRSQARRCVPMDALALAASAAGPTSGGTSGSTVGGTAGGTAAYRVAPHREGPESALPDEALWAALGALPPKQRECVAYHHVADLTYAEVARIVGGTEVAARRAAADGIAALRRTYRPTQPHPREA